MKRAPPPGGGSRRDRAVVGLDDPGDDRQAEAGAGLPALAAALRAPEALEQRGRVARREPGPWSRTSSCAARPPAPRAPSPASRRGVGERVAHAGCRPPGAGGRRRRRRSTASGRLRVISRSGAAARAASTASRASVGRSTSLAQQLALFVEARERQQVLDEHAHARGLGLDARHRLLLVGGIAGGADPVELGVAADRGERGAQLVRGVGEEAAQLAPRWPCARRRRRSICPSIALSARPRRPTSVRSVAGSTRCDRSPARDRAGRALHPLAAATARAGRARRRRRRARAAPPAATMSSIAARAAERVARRSSSGTAATSVLPPSQR